VSKIRKSNKFSEEFKQVYSMTGSYMRGARKEKPFLAEGFLQTDRLLFNQQ
jgi:hypothetical protein